MGAHSGGKMAQFSLLLYRDMPAHAASCYLDAGIRGSRNLAHNKHRALG